MTEQIEQDLMISRALIDLYNDPHVKDGLIFRGGTALNKLFINPPTRYSEDIDFVQKKSDPIGQTIDAIRALLKPWLGDPKWKITQRSAKLIYKYESVNKIPAKLKIEINTTEHFQVLPLKTMPFSMDSAWFKGTADIITYEIDVNRVFDIFYKYCSYNDVKISGEEFLKNLELKKNHRDFHMDMSVLLPSKLHWNFDEAYQFVVDNVISRLP